MKYCLKLLLVFLMTIPASFSVLIFSPFDREGRIAYKIARVWTWTILKVGGIRLKVAGLGGLDSSRPYVFISNHQSNIDIPVLFHSLTGFQLRWVAKKELIYVPIFGWAFWASKHILVNRSSRAKAMASIREAREKVKGGISVVFFAEGTRSSTGKLLPFKRGGFLLAFKTGTPIVPIIIKGSGRILPKGDWRIRNGEIEVIVGEPIAIDQSHPRDLSALLNRVRAIMESGLRTPVSSFSRIPSMGANPVGPEKIVGVK